MIATKPKIGQSLIRFRKMEDFMNTKNGALFSKKIIMFFL